MQDHHGSTDENSKQIESLKRELKALNAPLGATDAFPEGKLTADDEGELRFGITHNENNVIIAFGKRVAWTAMGEAQAREFADLLRQHANAIHNERLERRREKSHHGKHITGPHCSANTCWCHQGGTGA